MFGDAGLFGEAATVASGEGESKRQRSEATAAFDARLFAHVEKNQDTYVKRLAELVAIDSVSAEPARRPRVGDAVRWVQGWCDTLGATTRLEDLGNQTLSDGTSLALPPVLIASWGDPAAEPDKPVLVIYGHLDVQPAAKSDGWDTEPFVLTEVDGKLFGRGSTDDKGPVLAWLWAIEAYQALGRPLPCHLRCVFEGMEESGSIGLPQLVRELATAGKHLDPALVDEHSIAAWHGIA
jgi:nonspecific dipeptidase